jgi:hypothetical protein
VVNALCGTIRGRQKKIKTNPANVQCTYYVHARAQIFGRDLFLNVRFRGLFLIAFLISPYRERLTNATTKIERKKENNPPGKNLPREIFPR